MCSVLFQCMCVCVVSLSLSLYFLISSPVKVFVVFFIASGRSRAQLECCCCRRRHLLPAVASGKDESD